MDVGKYDKVRAGTGFIAALDQSGGSTPKALKLYGINEDACSSGEEMFGLVHKMRTRIITSPSFDGDRILRRFCSRTQWTATSGECLQGIICGKSKTLCRSSRLTRAWRKKPTGLRS